MNIIPTGMNPGASHPIQGSSHQIPAAQQMQPMSHVMHGAQPMGIPMQNAMGGHALHAMGGGIHMQPAAGVMGGQPSHMQLMHGNQMVQVQAMPGNPQAMAAVEEVDPITKAKSLLPQMKEQLASINVEFIKTLHCLASMENDSQSTSMPQLEQSFQDFFGTLDQIELNLKLVAEVLSQSSESRKYFPFNVHESPAPGQPTDNVVPYHQYSSIVESQVMYAQEVKELLTSRSKRVREQNVQGHPGVVNPGASE